MTDRAQSGVQQQRRTQTRNVLALTGDFVFFAIGFAFYDPMVVVPAFIQEFTGSELLVGVLAALRVIVITLPQVWAATLLEVQPRMKPVLIWSSIGGRLPILLLVLALMLWGRQRVGLTMGVLALSVMAFFTSEGLNSVSWPALVGKVVPEGFRGRFFGLGQLFSSVGSAGAGYLVNRTLALQNLDLSTRWALLFLGAFVGLMLSVGSMTFIRERGKKVDVEQPNVRRSLGKIKLYLRQDRWLRRVILVQLVIYTASASFTFFVVRARQIVPGADSMIGTFLMVQSVGSAVTALVGGFLVDHVGSWAAIRVVAAAEVLALAVATFAGFGWAPLPFYLAAFFLMGFVNGAAWWSFSAYLLDMASDARRPGYLATSGMLVGLTALNPIIVGALFQTLMPEIVFGVAALLALVGLALAWTLRRGLEGGAPGEA